MNAPYHNAWLDALLHDCDGYPTDQADTVKAALSQVLAERRSEDGSRLTGDGYPLELSFAARTGDVRWTADPWHPSLRRSPIECARRACTRLGLPCDRVERLAELGLGADFAWIGGRHGSDDRFKLYLSWLQRDDQLRFVEKELGTPILAPAVPASIRMIAIDPADDGLEVYWRAAPIAQQIPALLAPASPAERKLPLLPQIEELWGHCIRDRLPGGSIGVSFKIGSGGVRATLYFFARALWGSDRSIRRKWLERSDLNPDQRAAYEYASAGLAERHSCLTRHAMIGLHIGEDCIDLSLGVRPERDQ